MSNVILLKGDWILNQYGGDEGYLGWLALQPKYHRMKWSDFESDELESLGANISCIDKALTEYFEDDPIDRIYLIYMFESVFDKPKPTKYHFHMHLIPRFRCLDEYLREFDNPKDLANSSSTINAWKIPLLTKYSYFPTRYRRSESKVKTLIDGLRDKLEKKNTKKKSRPWIKWLLTWIKCLLTR